MSKKEMNELSLDDLEQASGGTIYHSSHETFENQFADLYRKVTKHKYRVVATNGKEKIFDNEADAKAFHQNLVDMGLAQAGTVEEAWK